MKYISLIKSYYPSLSKSEKKVADYILIEKEKLIYQTLTEVSKNVRVGEATIIRLVKKIGFKGFQDLKFSIAKEGNEEEHNYSNYIDKSEARISKAIGNTKSLLDKNQLEDSIEILLGAKQIYFYGVGSSALAACEAKNRFLRLGIVGICATDPHFQVMYSSICTSDDVILVFSLTGNTKDIIEALEVGRKNNVKIISVTSYASSHVAELSDYVLLTAEKENPLDGGSIVGRVSQMYILDLLFTGILLNIKSKALIINRKIAEEIVRKSAN